MHTLHTILTMTFLGTAILLTSACGPFTGNPIGQPEAEDYDRSCMADSECEIVWLSRACSCSSRTAVNASEVADVERDNERESRHEGRCRSQVDCAPFPSAEPYCNAGTCDLRDVSPTENSE